MGTVKTVRCFEDFLGLAMNSNTVIESFTCKRLLPPGENYGSEMLAVDVNIVNADGNDSRTGTYHFVAKMCPPLQVLKTVFNIQITFKKEVYFYNTIIPLLQKFQKTQDMKNILDFFPKYYASRFSLNVASNKVDDDAVLLLENLSYSDFRTIDRTEGFDLESTELILKDLALFHAVPIAMKLKSPVLFNERVRPFLQRSFFFNLSEAMNRGILESVMEAAKYDEECASLMVNIRNGFNLGSYYYKRQGSATEPFATIIHNDYWANNIMLKFTNKKPVQQVMLDFQFIEYGSPANDLIFFLYSSVETGVLHAHYDNFINLYYNSFITYLQELNCDTSDFSLELFQEEVNVSAKNMQFFHLLMMLKPMYMTKGKLKDLSQFDEDDFVANDNLSDKYYPKLFSVIKDFAKRKWI